jgi:anti-sigma regulatory factor (Ser/Thr protein kinase)
MDSLIHAQRHRVCTIGESSQIGEARRLASEMAQSSGFDSKGVGKVAIIVNEMGTNLIKHAHGGEILMRCGNGAEGGIELIALDQGRGIPNLEAAQRDGFSTAGSLGSGLGAIRRLSQLFDIYSQQGRGTAVLVRLWATVGTHAAPSGAFEIGNTMVAYPGEPVCGDQWAASQNFSTQRILLADGLGHGQAAAEASSAAVTVFERERSLAPAALINRAHAALRSTRGAAAAMAEIHTETHTVQYCGIGNIAAIILDGGVPRHLVSYNGTLGHEVRKSQEFNYPWPVLAHRHLPLLVMHSDGLSSHWKLEQYPGLIEHHPSLIASVLYRDFKRGKDDVTVLVAKEHKP